MTTLAQGNQVLNLILQHHTPTSHMQRLLASGLLSDLLDSNVDAVDRNHFREVLGLRPLKEKQYRKDGNALDRYPWLQRKFHFTGMDLIIEDEWHGASCVGRKGVAQLKVMHFFVTPENFEDKVIQQMERWKVNEASVLDHRGQEIGSAAFINDGWDTNWEFSFDDARFVVMHEAVSPSLVIVYEINKH